jgi:predicted outer membrane repeat protein
VFQGNSAAYGGAIFVEGGNSIVTLKGSIKFEDNVDSGYGGAIYNYGGTLKFILGASDTIEFKNTQTGFDICDSSGAVYLNGVTGSIIKFSRGIGNILIPAVDEEEEKPHSK